jgi:hypothetical protein
VSLARIGVCAVVLFLAACAAPSSEAPSPSSTPFSIGGQAAAIGCGNDIELQALDGSEIDLTGLWTEVEFADVALWNIRQVGDCFFMVYRDPGGDTDYSDEICDGRIEANLEITGRCVDFRGLGGFGADVQPQVFLIDFDATNEVLLQRCPASRAPGSCDEPMIRWDPENEPAETASPS